MLTLTQEDQFKISNGIQGIYFYATWMPFHKKMNLMISKVEKKYNNLSFVCVDVDIFKGLTKRFKIESIPTVLILNNGEEVHRITGLVMTSAFKSAFADIFNS